MEWAQSAARAASHSPHAQSRAAGNRHRRVRYVGNGDLSERRTRRRRRIGDATNRWAVRVDSVRARTAAGGEEGPSMRIAIAEGTITAGDLLADWLVVTENARLTIDASLA